MKTMLKTLALSLALGSAAQAATTIQYATWDATRQKADEALIAAFNKANPDVVVKYNLVPWDVYWQKAAAMTAGGSTFDVMWMNLDNFPFYQSQGALAPLNIPAAATKSIPGAMINPYKVSGNLYGVPLGPQAVAVFINRALFKERGVPIPTSSWTFEQMMDAAKKLTFQKDGKQIYGFNGNDMQTNREYGMSFYYSAGGKGIIKKSGSSYTTNLDATFENVSKKLWDTVHTLKVAPSPTSTTQQAYQQFLAGQMGILIEGTWMISTWSQNKALDWAFAPFPSMDGKPIHPVMSAHALVVPAASKNRDAAQKLITWMTTSTQAQRMLAQKGLLPTTYAPYKSQYLQSLPGRNAQVIFDQLPKSVVINADVLSVKNLPEVLDVLEQKMGLAWTGNASVADAIKQARDQMDGLLKQNK